MSILLKLLGWTGAPQWALELGAIGAVALGIWGWHLHTLHIGIERGIARQVGADNAATAKLQAQAARATAALQARSAAAEKAYAKAQSDLAAYRAAHPVGPVVLSGGLCDGPSYGGGSGLPAAGTPDGGDARSGAGAGSIQRMPAGDHPVGPQRAPRDIGPLLDALAGRADAVADELREWQAH